MENDHKTRNKTLVNWKANYGDSAENLCVTKWIKKDWLYVEGYERCRLPLVPRSRQWLGG